MLCPITEMRSRPGVWLTYSRTSSASRLPHESMPSNVCRSKRHWCQDGRAMGAAELLGLLLCEKPAGLPTLPCPGLLVADTFIHQVSHRFERCERRLPRCSALREREIHSAALVRYQAQKAPGTRHTLKRELTVDATSSMSAESSRASTLACMRYVVFRIRICTGYVSVC